MSASISVTCGNCDKTAKVGSMDGGLIFQCQQCGTKATVPFPGIGRAAYVGWKALKFTAVSMLASHGDGVFLILVLPSIALSVWLAYLRGINIGLKPVTACLIGIIPGSFFYFFVMRTGSLKNTRA